MYVHPSTLHKHACPAENNESCGAAAMTTHKHPYPMHAPASMLLESAWDAGGGMAGGGSQVTGASEDTAGASSEVRGAPDDT